MDVVDRFLTYVKIDTQSDENNTSTPSTNKQFDLAKLVEKEMINLGLKNVSLDDNCYLMGTLPSNTSKKVPSIGFIAHFDTSPDFNGANVNPRIVENYDGNNIVLNKENNIILSPDIFPELLKYTGESLIVTDGTTLLGADDKAGVAEIISAIEYLTKNPNIKHGDIHIGFTPDEEIGRGANKFNVKKFGADWAYTMDGGEIGSIEYENFNAASAVITIQGIGVHPGSSHNKMINAMHVANELINMLPVSERPEYTDEYEGFFHLHSIKGLVDYTTISFIIRDHDRNLFEKKKTLMTQIVSILNFRYNNILKLNITDQYYNMKEIIEPVKYIVDYAYKAIEEVGIIPKTKPIRGGTDGARLSYMGLPCPNIFAGGCNFHSKYEFIPVRSMKKAVEVIVKISELVAK